MALKLRVRRASSSVPSTGIGCRSPVVATRSVAAVRRSTGRRPVRATATPASAASTTPMAPTMRQRHRELGEHLLGGVEALRDDEGLASPGGHGDHAVGRVRGATRCGAMALLALRDRQLVGPERRRRRRPPRSSHVRRRRGARAGCRRRRATAVGMVATPRVDRRSARRRTRAAGGWRRAVARMLARTTRRPRPTRSRRPPRQPWAARMPDARAEREPGRGIAKRAVLPSGRLRGMRWVAITGACRAGRTRRRGRCGSGAARPRPPSCGAGSRCRPRGRCRWSGSRSPRPARGSARA